MDKQVKKREWVKTAAIIFLAVLLALTFFSNTIMNRTLPEVSTAQVTDGNISAKVRGTGIVSAIGNTDIKSPATTTIASVKVKSGQEVNSGDVLFILGEQSDELTAAEEELATLQFQLQRYQNSYPTEAVSDSSVQSAWNAYELAKVTTKTIKEKLDSMPSSKEVAQALSDYNNAKATLEALLFQKSEIISKIESELSLAILDNKTEEADILVKKLAEANTDSTEIQQARKEAAEKEAKYNAMKAYDYDLLLSEYESALRSEQAAESAYRQAVESYNSSISTNDQSITNINIDVNETQNKISKLQKKITELKGGEDSGGITAPVGGIISSVTATAGMSVAKGDLLCTIEVPDQGFLITFSVTNDQAKRLKVGDTATISNFYWGSEITATVSSIAADSKNPQTNKSITCNLEGDVNSGDSLTVSIGSKSANYDTVVPKSAVRTDSNGTYVLMVESKNSALGNRYYARRVDVEQLATDDVNVAVNGNLNYGDFVITTSSEPVSGNTQVRMADNN